MLNAPRSFAEIFVNTVSVGGYTVSVNALS